jgi:hypothetical protein
MDKTLDLSDIANLRPGETVEVRRLGTTEDDFEKTLELLTTRVARGSRTSETSAGHTQPLDPQQQTPRVRKPDEFVPQDEQLRSVFLFAEAVGGYQQFHDLVYKYSPGLSLIARVSSTVAKEPLRPLQTRDLTEYRDQIVVGLAAARTYLTEHGRSAYLPDRARPQRFRRQRSQTAI